MFVDDLTVGLFFTLIPLYVHQYLRLNNTLGSLAVGIQFLATVLIRGFAGRSADYGAVQSIKTCTV